MVEYSGQGGLSSLQTSEILGLEKELEVLPRSFNLGPIFAAMQNRLLTLGKKVSDDSEKDEEKKQEVLQLQMQLAAAHVEQTKLSAEEKSHFDKFIAKEMFHVNDVREAEKFIEKNINKLNAKEQVKLGNKLRFDTDPQAQKEIIANPKVEEVSNKAKLVQSTVEALTKPEEKKVLEAEKHEASQVYNRLSPEQQNALIEASSIQNSKLRAQKIADIAPIELQEAAIRSYDGKKSDIAKSLVPFLRDGNARQEVIDIIKNKIKDPDAFNELKEIQKKSQNQQDNPSAKAKAVVDFMEEHNLKEKVWQTMKENHTLIRNDLKNINEEKTRGQLANPDKESCLKQALEKSPSIKSAFNDLKKSERLTLAAQDGASMETHQELAGKLNQAGIVKVAETTSPASAAALPDGGRPVQQSARQIS